MVVTRDPEVLFKEARRRTRRRRIAWAVLVSVIAAAAAFVVLIASGALSTQSGPGARSGPASTAGPTVPLKRPEALAVAPNGTLYIVDPQRDQILTLLPSGRFAVFAGSGKPGFSGDGGPATHARLRLDSNSTLTLARDGTAYVADTGNSRVRAITPEGTIRTLVRVSHPTGLAIGPHDRLYIGGEGLFLLSLRDGKLRRLVGWGLGQAPGWRHNRAEGILATSSLGDVAVVGGDVYVVSFPGIFERTSTGALRCLGSFRAAGAAAPLTEGPDGALYGADFRVFRLSTSALDARGSCDGGMPLIAERSTQIVSNRTIKQVDEAVGWRDLARAHPPLLSPASGLAVSSDGAVYYDAQSGNGWATGALLEVTPSGHVRVLWRAPH